MTMTDTSPLGEVVVSDSCLYAALLEADRLLESMGAPRLAFVTGRVAGEDPVWITLPLGGVIELAAHDVFDFTFEAWLLWREWQPREQSTRHGLN